MSSISFTAAAIDSVTIGGYQRPYLDVSVDLDEPQMKELLDEIVGQVTEKTFRQWIDELAADYIEEIRSEAVALGREQAESERSE